MYAICPYCREQNREENIIDYTGGKKVRRNIYLCPECNEVFEGNPKVSEMDIPVDLYFERPYQYMRSNLKCL